MVMGTKMLITSFCLPMMTHQWKNIKETDKNRIRFNKAASPYSSSTSQTNSIFWKSEKNSWNDKFIFVKMLIYNDLLFV